MDAVQDEKSIPPTLKAMAVEELVLGLVIVLNGLAVYRSVVDVVDFVLFETCMIMFGYGHRFKTIYGFVPGVPGI